MATTDLVFDLLARDRASATFAKVGRNAESAHSKILGLAVKGAAAFGVVTAAAGVFAYKVGSDYVNSLNQIQALTGANNKQMRAAASTLEHNAGAYAKMGQTTGDAASGVVELTKSGLSLHNALKAVYGTMTLAKAGELSVADASAVTANALNTFHLKAKQAGDVANYLANAANISSADVSDIAESLKYVAPVAATAGVSIQQTSAALAELANAGLKGSQAGTSLRTFLLNLQAPSKQAANVMHDLGINIYDATGKMKPLGDVIGILQNKLGGLNQADRTVALKSIFSKTGIAGATTIINDGVKGFNRYTAGIDRAGAASKLAQARSKGLAGSFAIIKASAISAAQSLYRQFSPIADRVIRPLATKFAGFAQNIGPDISKGLAKLHNLGASIHLGNMGSQFAKEAKGWAQSIITGVSTGLNTGNWSGLGKALGTGILKAAQGLGNIADKMMTAFEKVDWVGLGIKIGQQAVPFVIGFAAGILAFDPTALFHGIVKHWSTILLGLLTIILPEGKAAEKIAEVLGRIPFLGKLLAWGFKALNGFGRKIVGKVWEALRFLGRAFMEGFSKVFPEVGGRFSKWLSLLPLHIGSAAIDIARAARRMVGRLGDAIANGAASVARAIGHVIGFILKPWADSASWLISKGVAILRGLLRGVTSKAGDVFGWFKGLAGRVIGAIPNPLGILDGVGRNIIDGLWSGLESTWSKVSGWLSAKISSLSGIAKKLLGIHSPSRVFAGIGMNVMEGLHLGLTKGFPKVQSVLSKLTNYISAQGQKLGSLMSAKSQFAQGFQSFTTSVFSTDLSKTTTDAQGNDVTTPATIADMLAYQKSEAAKAAQLKRDVARLHKLGLSNSLIKQLQASGESGIAQIHTLAGGSRTDIAQLNALNKQTESSLQGAGEIAGGQLYNAQIRSTRAQEETAKHLRRLVDELVKGDKGEIHIHLEGHTLVESIKKHQRKKGVPANNRVKG